MQRDIAEIRKLCDTFRTEPKLLVIPSSGIRTQMLKTLGDHGVFPLNMSIKTVRELSYDLAEDSIHAARLTILDSKGVTDAMTDVLNALRDNGELRFFNAIEITSGICKALSGTVLELFGWGYLHGAVGLDGIVNKFKQTDLEKIIDAYVSWKKANGYVDYADVIERALTVTQGQKARYAGSYALDACEFNLLESRLLSGFGIQQGTGDTLPAGDAAISSQDLSVERTRFFDAYGEYNEVKEVLRRVILEKIPFDNVLIISTVSEPYSQLFYQLIQQYTYKNDAFGKQQGLPMTFGAGLPLLQSSPAKLLMLLLDWIGSGYTGHALINIFTSGVFDVTADQRGPDGVMPDREDMFGRLTVVNAIKNSGLTWQRRSYMPCLEKHLGRVKVNNPDNDKSVMAAQWLIGFLSDAFEEIPQEDELGMVDVESLLSSLKTIVRRYKRISSAFDSQGLSVALFELNTTIKGRRARLPEAIEIIKEHVRDVRIMCESPAPGKLHFTTYKQAAWIERKNVFLVGLGSDNFPGMAIEDPLLLDHERMDQMTTSARKIGKNIGIMNSLLGSFAGELTCSYSSFNTLDIRECYPATLFHRLRDVASDDTMSSVGFIAEGPGRFIDESDYWLSKGVKSGAILDNSGREQELTTFEIPQWLSAEQMSETVLSASSLSDYLSCKHKFFLKNILRLREVRDQEVDALGWLTSRDTGTIYHSIFEKFLYHAMENPGILEDEGLAVKGISIITEAEISRLEDELPTASSFHTERQREEVLENAARFAANEVQMASGRKTVEVEMPFGGDEEPLNIKLGEGRRVKVSGFIDRVDITEDGDVEITDYKTGGKRNFENLMAPEDAGITEGNAQLALYYLALLELARTGDDPELKKLQDITKMSYYFVTAKGDYDILSLSVDEDSEELYKSALVELLQEIEKGQFPPEKGAVRLVGKDRAPSCGFCGYREVCTCRPDGD